MFVSFKTLKAMAEECYERGKDSTPEMREQHIEEVLARHAVSNAQEIRIYCIDELKRFKVGSKFHHSILGRCEIINKKGVKMPVMQFENGITYSFTQDGYPWTEPMLYLPE